MKGAGLYDACLKTKTVTWGKRNLRGNMPRYDYDVQELGRQRAAGGIPVQLREREEEKEKRDGDCDTVTIGIEE